MAKKKRTGIWISSIVEKFLEGYASWMLLFFAIFAGFMAIFLTPREEDPQIVVPLADVYVYYPGGSAKEVEYLVTNPLEKLLWQIDGVEYVYSTSRRDMSIVTVRFYVGEDREDSLLKIYNKLYSHLDQVTPGIQGWVVKPVEIDDVPIVNLTLYSKKYGPYELRRMGEEVLKKLESLPNISRTRIVGGLKREIRLEMIPEKLAGMGLSPLEVFQVLKAQNASLTAGEYKRNNKRISVFSGPFLSSLEEVQNLVVGNYHGKPVYLKEVARILDGPEEPKNYTRIGFGPASSKEKEYPFPVSAVTLAIAKKKGTNAVWVAQNVLREMKTIQKNYLPKEVEYAVTRNYGKTADDKVNELIEGLLLAILTVVVLLALTMGWKEGLIVSTAVPVSFALALLCNYLAGYTINRVTLFALILSLGMVVDDPITNVDNIQRHILTGKPHKNPFIAALAGVSEVLPPVIMATLAIIISFLPMFFITGMMGPYMQPMAINVPLAMFFSLVSSLTIVPWMAYHLLKRRFGEGFVSEEEEAKGGWVMRFYRRIMEPFLDSRGLSIFFLGIIGLLLLVSAYLALSGNVPLKMLPFDNKDEFQITVHMPEGTTLEETNRVVEAFEQYLKTIPEVTNYVSYVGDPSPMDFNGMVRHYYLRKGPHFADIRINLVHKDKRKQQSHGLTLRVRKDLEGIARKYGARIQIVETPPGPPVLSTIVAEVYGTPDKSYEELIAGAKIVLNQFQKEANMADIDWSVENTYEKYRFQVDKVKASLHGISAETVVQTLRMALAGASPGKLHLLYERNPLNINLILPRKLRSSLKDLIHIPVKGRTGNLVMLGEIGKFLPTQTDQPIYHKNLRPLVYVAAEVVGRPPAEKIFSLQNHFSKNPLPKGLTINWRGEGEWKITVDVFRDLGIAFGVALIGIYFLLVFETSSLFMPLIIMLSIPLTAIGIMPGFYLLNLLVGDTVGGYWNPVFFTATAMIGMIALGGIVIRNALVLIDFIHTRLDMGMELREAILESGGVRFRPIVLTAATTALGAWPITLDPIFSGLAWSLIFGITASTIFTLVVVPVVYWMIYGRKQNLEKKENLES
ncbi:MAG: efflux RND transporter permease subunit [Planctomycetota bacterium]|nr:MAG: efflux RND transporter permease subunit [Planctomycetota bacterium]